MKEHEKKTAENLKNYYMLGLPLLGTMAILATTGCVLSVIAKCFL